METPRVRLGTFVEWFAAAVLLLGALAVGSSLAGSVRTAAAVTPLSAHGPGTALATAAIPSGSVSIPVLLLLGDTNVSLGDTVTAVAARLGVQAESAPVSTERTENGDRLTRTYDVSGTRFALVFQQLPSDPEPRVYAIYLLP